MCIDKISYVIVNILLLLLFGIYQPQQMWPDDPIIFQLKCMKSASNHANVPCVYPYSIIQTGRKYGILIHKHYGFKFQIFQKEIRKCEITGHSMGITLDFFVFTDKLRSECN